jgi:hypothetical protein
MAVAGVVAASASVEDDEGWELGEVEKGVCPRLDTAGVDGASALAGSAYWYRKGSFDMPDCEK